MRPAFQLSGTLNDTEDPGAASQLGVAKIEGAIQSMKSVRTQSDDREARFRR
jgi:hypothetical protein